MRSILLSKYGSRLFWFGILFVTLPVIVLGGYSYFKASSIALEKVNEGNAQVTLQTELRVEQFLKAVDAASLELVSSPLVNSAIERELAYPEFQFIQELRQYMQRIQSYELRIQDVQLINTSKQWAMDNTGLYRLDEYKATLPVDDYASNGKNSFWTSGGGKTNDLATTTGTGGAVSLVRKLPLNAKQPTLFVVIKLTLGDINKYVEDVPGMGTTYILDERSRVLADPQGNLIGQPFPGSELLAQLERSGQDAKPFQARFKGQDVSVSFKRSAYNDWLYMTLVPVVDVTRESRTIGLITLLICAGIMAVALIGVYAHSRNLYGPIRKLYESVSGATPVAGTKKRLDELQFIDERFRTMHRSHDELERQMYGQRQQLKEFFVLKLLQGEVRGVEVAGKLAEFQFPLDWQQQAVLVAQIDSLEDSRFAEADRDLLLFAINNMASELIPADSRLSPILIHPSQLTLVGSDSGDAERFKISLYTAAERMQAAARDYLGLRISVGISRPFRGWNGAPNAAQEGLEALKYRIKLGSEAIIFIEDLQPAAGAGPHYPKVVTGHLLDAIKLLQLERIDDLLHQYIADCLASGQSPRDYQVHLARLLIELLDLGQQFGATWNRRFSPFERLQELHTAGEIEQWLRHDIIASIVEAVERLRIPPDRNITDQMLQLIHERIESELTLEACAAELHFHPSHLKRVFRRDMGVSFSEYVSDHRLQIAKRWLTQSPMKVSEIAERLQYNNSQNFIRYFRKIEGVTPGQYRDMHKHSG
ncbi:MAG: helix-turn-helix domain-containing protein [Paenibacillaceae bacterium]|nr:helix-turn-helix domain-containing protein [Paenibacillaceae bacterium]